MAGSPWGKDEWLNSDEFARALVARVSARLARLGYDLLKDMCEIKHWRREACSTWLFGIGF
jgi:hypothetical protein